MAMTLLGRPASGPPPAAPSAGPLVSVSAFGGDPGPAQPAYAARQPEAALGLGPGPSGGGLKRARPEEAPLALPDKKQLRKHFEEPFADREVRELCKILKERFPFAKDVAASHNSALWNKVTAAFAEQANQEIVRAEKSLKRKWHNLMNEYRKQLDRFNKTGKEPTWKYWQDVHAVWVSNGGSGQVELHNQGDRGRRAGPGRGSPLGGPVDAETMNAMATAFAKAFAQEVREEHAALREQVAGVQEQVTAVCRLLERLVDRA